MIQQGEKSGRESNYSSVRNEAVKLPRCLTHHAGALPPAAGNRQVGGGGFEAAAHEHIRIEPAAAEVALQIKRVGQPTMNVNPVAGERQVGCFAEKVRAIGDADSIGEKGKRGRGKLSLALATVNDAKDSWASS